MIAMVMALALASGQTMAAAPPAAPSAEAEALGIALARTGVLPILLPQLAGKDVEEMIGEHPDLSTTDKEQLRAAAKVVLADQTERLMTLIGHDYAVRLSIDDLKVLVAFNAGAPAQHWRAAEPSAIMAAAKALDSFDFKKSVAADFCKTSGKLCEGEGKK
jgi:hypothetical protein